MRSMHTHAYIPNAVDVVTERQVISFSHLVFLIFDRLSFVYTHQSRRHIYAQESSNYTAARAEENPLQQSSDRSSPHTTTAGDTNAKDKERKHLSTL